MRQPIFIALLLVCCSTLNAQQNQRIFINDFLASNVTINADIVDFDDYSDWIELYNDEDVDVDIGGYFITDDLADPYRYQFPSNTVIKAKNYLFVWADGYDDIPGKTYRRDYYPNDYFTTRYYHLNFSLGRSGESIALFAADSILVDSVHFGLQLRDVSMGRQPDGSADWFYFGEPTPQAANNTNGVSNTELAEHVIISPESGFYQGSQTVTLSATSAEAQIRFTLDGSKPTSASELYMVPLDIAQNTVLRAGLFETDKLPGTIITRTYFIDETLTLPVVSITTDPETLWDDVIGIYEHNYKEREIPVSFEFFESTGDLGFELAAGLRLTGQASLLLPQKSFTIYARERYGTDVIHYQVFPQREVNQFSALYLRNAGYPDNTSTFFRDAMQHSLVLNKVAIDALAYIPAAVFLNGEYWGIYNIRDKINSEHLGSIDNLNPDDIDLLEYETGPIPVVMDGNADNYNAFYDFIEATDLSVEENYRELETWMYIDEFISYTISEIFFDNTFLLDQNVRMWRERKDDGKWRWILFDTDYGFGMPNQRSTGYRYNTLAFATGSNSDDPFVLPEWSTLIFRQLLSNDTFKTRFIQ